MHGTTVETECVEGASIVLIENGWRPTLEAVKQVVGER